MEAIFVLGLFLLGLLPLAILAQRARSRFGAVLAVLAGLGTAGGLLAMVARTKPPIMIAGVPTNRPIEVHEDGYVSSQTCRSCHPGNYDTWHDSYHRTMTQVATPETVKGNFSNQVVHVEGLTFRMERIGDEFWVEASNATNSAAAPMRNRVTLVTGSHHMQVYWIPTGATRKLEPVPIIYLFEAERWIPRKAAFLLGPGAPPFVEVGRWNETCNSCHTTRPRPRLFGPDEMDTRVAEFGIACEACHGPAEEHVRVNRDPLRRYSSRMAQRDDDTIAHPGKMSAVQGSQVCGRCHTIGHQTALTASEWKDDGVSYRPGEDLNKYVSLVHIGNKALYEHWEERQPSFIRDRFWSDGMVRVSGREYNALLDSPCYAHGTGERQMSCFSCHAMHQPAGDPRPRSEWANDQLKPGMDGSRACLQCHEDIGRDIGAHTHHRVDSAGSNCYNCHMPYTTYGLLKAMRSHTVSSPTVQSSVDTGRPNACNQCHLDKTMEWSAEHMHRWYGIEKPQLTDDQREIAASILWTLKGDAGQRALMAWSMGWEPAKEASGSDWLTPYLLPLLVDPYDAVRYIAQRSLRGVPGVGEFSYDFVGPESEQRVVAQRLMVQWRSRPHPGEGRAALLLDAKGQIRQDIFLRLFAERDNKVVSLAE
ncbi:MAG: C cytochrome precursor [Verrucomicrobiota bacterium]